MNILFEFLKTTGAVNMSGGNLLMILIGMVFISLAIRKDYEPLLLLPIGFGVLTCDTLAQAMARAAGGPEDRFAGNKGAECAAAAIEMITLLRALPPVGESS